MWEQIRSNNQAAVIPHISGTAIRRSAFIQDSYSITYNQLILLPDLRRHVQIRHIRIAVASMKLVGIGNGSEVVLQPQTETRNVMILEHRHVPGHRLCWRISEQDGQLVFQHLDGPLSLYG